jgi:hypothetical protein
LLDVVAAGETACGPGDVTGSAAGTEAVTVEGDDTVADAVNDPDPAPSPPSDESDVTVMIAGDSAAGAAVVVDTVVVEFTAGTIVVVVVGEMRVLALERDMIRKEEQRSDVKGN